MYHNGDYTSVNEALPDLLRVLNDRGHTVESRVGETVELTHLGITLREPLKREILVPHRKPNLAAQIAETMWVLAGKDDIGWLEHYLPRARDFSDDGIRWRAGYGARLRCWPRRDESGDTVDQFRWVVDHLKNDLGSRRAVMSIWDPIIDTVGGKDIPCNDWLSFLCRDGRLDLHVAVRSNDIMWGWSGINQFEWSVLLEVVAGLVGAEPGCLHFSTTSFHLYDRHYDKARAIVGADAHHTLPEYMEDSPRFDATVVDCDFDRFDSLLHEWFTLEKAIRHGEVSAEAVAAFPEPMLRSWLHVIQWWWTGDKAWLASVASTRLREAVDYSVQPKREEVVEEVVEETSPSMQEALDVTTRLISEGGHIPQIKRALRLHGVNRVRDLDGSDIGSYLEALRYSAPSKFIEEVCALHDQKHAAYGDSWKKRGESFSIIPNIARKVDRLGNGETDDESSTDTACDLMVYLAKYTVWLDEQVEGPIFTNWGGTDNTLATNEVMMDVDRRCESYAVHNAEQYLKETFELLLRHVENAEARLKEDTVKNMLWESYRLARTLWEKDHEGSLDLDGAEYLGADVD